MRPEPATSMSSAVDSLGSYVPMLKDHHTLPHPRSMGHPIKDGSISH